MLDVDLTELMDDDMSRYALVTATAKRARQITDKAIAEKEIIIEKTVSLAVEEIKSGKCRIIDHSKEECRED